jgi:hypothetical protein
MTLSPFSSLPTRLSGTAIDRIASRLVARHAPPPPDVETDGVFPLRTASIQEIPAEVHAAGFERVGSLTYRHPRTAHTLWSLERVGEQYQLVRLASEPQAFPEDEQPPARTAASDGPEVGTEVVYPLGGQEVRGKVVRRQAGLLDIDLGGQVDQGVPAGMVRMARAAPAATSSATHRTAQADPPRDTPEHNADQADKDNLGLSMHPEAQARFEATWATYGAVLADELAKPLASSALERIRATASRRQAAAAAGERSRVSSWSALAGYAGEKTARVARTLTLTGVAVRRASQTLRLPFALAWQLWPELAATPLATNQKIRAAFGGDRAAQVEVDREVQPTVLKAWREAFAHHQTGTLPLQQKVAVDQAAEDYWRAYFGTYGDTWVREVKRRVRADLVSATLQRQGVDQSAADYWSDYFGEYGDDLVGDPERATDSVTEVKPNREASAAAPAPPPPAAPAPVAPPADRFAGITALLEESRGTSRVAMVAQGTGFEVWVRAGGKDTATPYTTRDAAIAAFRTAVHRHLF